MRVERGGVCRGNGDCLWWQIGRDGLPSVVGDVASRQGRQHHNSPGGAVSSLRLLSLILRLASLLAGARPPPPHEVSVEVLDWLDGEGLGEAPLGLERGGLRGRCGEEARWGREQTMCNITSSMEASR